MFESFDWGILKTGLIILVGLCFTATSALDILRRRGVIKKGAAADWNQGATALLAIVVGGLQQFGMADQLPGIEAGAEQWAALAAAVFVISSGTKVMHEVKKWFDTAWKRPPRDVTPKELAGGPVG